MISLYRLKGRALQIDNALIMTLAFFTGIFLIITAGFLPVLYERIIMPMLSLSEGLVYYGVNLFFSFLFLMVAFGFYSSVRLGAKRYLLKKVCKQKPASRDMFFYFMPKEYFRSFFYSLRILGIKLLLFIFCFLPSLICFITVDRFSRQGVSALVCLSLSVTALCLGINGGAFYSLFKSSLFLCDYYFIEGTYVSFRHLLASSQKNMNGKNTFLMRFKMSFIGWFILSFLLFPIPYVWGYYNQSLAVAAAEFMKGKKG